MKNLISKSVPIFALVSGLWASNVYADIAPGTVITAANFEQSLSQKFEGTPLGDMLWAQSDVGCAKRESGAV